jgi:hypothetical protein
MRFKSFKGFTLGKPKGSPGGSGPAGEVPTAEQSSLMGEKINGRTRDLEKMTHKIQDLAGTPGGEVEGPHGPLGELSIEPEDQAGEKIPNVFVSEAEETVQEDVKVVETSLEEKPAADTGPAAGPGDNGNSLSGLFSEDEEEANPLANLIKSLPEYTTHEIVEDLNEIKRIIHEWQRE